MHGNNVLLITSNKKAGLSNKKTAITISTATCLTITRSTPIYEHCTDGAVIIQTSDRNPM